MRLAAILGLMLLVASALNAQVTGHLAGQFGIPQSMSCGPTHSGLDACTTPGAQPDEHCARVSGNVQSLYGTFTVKRPGVQVLMWIFCNATPSENGQTLIYMAERYEGTSDVSMSHLPAGISGHYCWVDWGECQTNQSYLPNGDWEYQFVIGGGGP